MPTMVEVFARGMAENAGFNWNHCAQSQWRSDAEAGLAAIRAAGYEVVHITRTVSRPLPIDDDN